IKLSFEDFHAANLTSRSSYVLDPQGVVLPDFVAYALGGSVKGRVNMRFDGLKFRAETRLKDIRLSLVAPAIDHAGFPVDKLHWDALISADTVETWHDNFRDFDITARMHWDQPEQLAAGHVPVAGDWKLRYRYEPDILSLEQLEFETPTSRGSITGVLDPKSSALDVRLDVGALDAWNDFIHAEHMRYQDFALDSLDGELTYSPHELVINKGRARRGVMEAEIDIPLSNL